MTVQSACIFLHTLWNGSHSFGRRLIRFIFFQNLCSSVQNNRFTKYVPTFCIEFVCLNSELFMKTYWDAAFEFKFRSSSTHSASLRINSKQAKNDFFFLKQPQQ